MANKPAVIMCLDEKLANEVIKAMPDNKYEIILANSHFGRRDINGAPYKEADANLALSEFEKHKSSTGFIIADENAGSSMSGVTPLLRAGKSGWHTVLRTGAVKDGFASLVDLYLSGETSKDAPNAESIAKFVAARVDEQGNAILKEKTTQLIKWQTAVDEIDIPDKDRVRAIVAALVDEIAEGKHPDLQKSMKSDVTTRDTMRKAVKNIVSYLENPSVDTKIISNADLRRLDEASKPISEQEKLFRESPTEYYKAGYDEVLRRERAGDDWPGAAKEYLERAREMTPGLDIKPDNHNSVDGDRMQRILALTPNDKIKPGLGLMEDYGIDDPQEQQRIKQIGYELRIKQEREARSRAGGSWSNRNADKMGTVGKELSGIDDDAGKPRSR